MSFLESVQCRKQLEVAALKKRSQERPFEQALRAHPFTVIAELKRRSPSVGFLSSVPDPITRAQEYRLGGAAAISVLTDQAEFGGSLEDLRKVAALPIPVLRKDFIIDRVQLTESLLAGASAVLLIVALLGDRTGSLLCAAHELGLEALVEVHTEKELEVALKAGARIVGVNNRDLSTLNVSLKTAERLGPLIPDDRVKVAESGIATRFDVVRMQDSGYDAALIGTALMSSKEPLKLLQEMVVE